MKKPILDTGGAKCLYCGKHLRPRGWDTWTPSFLAARDEPRPIVGAKDFAGNTIIAVMPPNETSIFRGSIEYATDTKLGYYRDGFFCNGTCARHFAVLTAKRQGHKPAHQSLRNGGAT